MNKTLVVALSLIVVAVAGCSTTSGPTRTKAPGDAGVNDKNAYLQVHDKYTMGFIEFDEQGDFWSRDLATKVIEDAATFAAKARGNREQTLLVAYVHGWQNNARSLDVQNFKTFLDSLQGSLVGARGKKIAVYGVYLAWRGRLLPTPDHNDPLSRLVDDTVYAVPKILSFWTREAAGERVAKLSSTEALLRLNQAVRAGDPNARSVVIGHSFGALVVENSLAQATLSRVYGDESGNSTARPPVDLTVLLNQAAPSMTAKRLQEGLTDAYRASRIDPPIEQPIIVSVTSTDDKATGMAFPVGRLLETLFARGRSYDAGAERSQHTYMRATAGHLPSMYSHKIVKYDPAKAGRPKKPDRLPSMPLIPSALESPPPPEVTAAVSRQNEDNLLATRLDPNWDFSTSQQRWFVDRKTKSLWQTPYWIVSVNQDFIKGHGGVWNDNVVQFIISLIQRNRLFIEEPTVPVVEKAAPSSGLVTQR